MKMESAWIGRRKKGMVIGMEQYIIKGGNPLVGEVAIGGAKMQLWEFWQVPSWQMRV